MVVPIVKWLKWLRGGCVSVTTDKPSSWTFGPPWRKASSVSLPLPTTVYSRVSFCQYFEVELTFLAAAGNNCYG